MGRIELLTTDEAKRIILTISECPFGGEDSVKEAERRLRTAKCNGCNSFVNFLLTREGILIEKGAPCGQIKELRRN